MSEVSRLTLCPSLSLQTFLLDGNSLDELPNELGSLQRLSYVGLSFNQFDHVPQVLEQLGSMEKLCMAGNNLETLTLQNFRLLRIKHIDLRYNSEHTLLQMLCFFLKIGFQQLYQETIITWGPESCLDKATYPMTQCYHHTNDRNKNRVKKPKHEQTARQHEIRKSFACRGSTRCVPTVCKSTELEWLALFLQLILHSFCLCLDKVSKHIF